ncbi:MAG: DUF86 domain-containing protein [Desulfobacterales bacterium]|nr:DUF86 domain-containing protein [Desulfobacterales bacterium]
MKERIHQKIAKIKEYISLINSIKDECLKKFISDPIYQGALLHYLYLLADSCISLSEMVIKYKQLRIPQSYHEVFDILGENNILEREFAYSFAKIAGFRNFLAHDYEKIEPEVICNEVLLKIFDIEIFIKQIEKSIH